MKHIAEHRGTPSSVIVQGGFSFLLIQHFQSVNIEEIESADAIIIEAKSNEFARLVASFIRGHLDPNVYLKPIILMQKGESSDDLLMELADGVIKGLDQLEGTLQTVERMLKRKKDLVFTNSISYEAQQITRLIALLYIKEIKNIEPIPHPTSNTNYAYPLMSVNFSADEEHLAIEMLNLAEKEGILRSEYFDRIYCCSSCSSGHLSYREVCPKCSSSNTTPDDVIHHFPCGYVGPRKDFSNEIDDLLDCPKCNKRLRHIGVDYDKPSIIHECNNCNHRFQDYYVNAKCLSCKNDQLVDNLKSQDIRSYRLTKKGELAAVKGFNTTSKDIEEVMGTIKYDTFNVMLKYEIERLKQTEGNSNICAIRIANSSEVYSKLGSEVQKGLLKDLVSVIRSNIRTSDVISFESSSIIVLSMNDIPYKIAQNIMKDIITILMDLVKASFENLTIDFQTNVLALNFNRPYKVQIRELINQFE